jgi:hypothetical protein
MINHIKLESTPFMVDKHEVDVIHDVTHEYIYTTMSDFKQGHGVSPIDHISPAQQKSISTIDAIVLDTTDYNPGLVPGRPGTNHSITQNMLDQPQIHA